jgi:hypothetical protein
MKKLTIIALAALAPTAALADVNLRGTGQMLTGDCGGGAATINSTGSGVTITGNCRSVTVIGDGNMVTIALADGATITVRGTGNLINWTGAQRVAPRRSISGTGNVVQRQAN